MITFITSLVLSLTVLAQETPTDYISPCFPNSAQAQRALRKIEFIKAPIDKIKRDNNCIEILTVKRREELYRSYLAQNFRLFTLKEKSLAPPKSCYLELEKTTYENVNDNSYQIGEKIKADRVREKNKKVTSSQIIVQSGQSASIGSTESRRILLLNNIAVIQNNSTLNINCIVLHKGYQIKISSSDPKHNINTSSFVPFGGSIELGSLNAGDQNNTSKIDLTGIKNIQNQSDRLTTFRLRAKNQR